MSGTQQNKVTAEMILRDPAIGALPTPPTRLFVAKQLRDLALQAMNVDALAGMGFEEIVHRLFVGGEAEPEGTEEPEEQAESEQEKSLITVATDMLAVTAAIVLREPGPGEEPPTEQQIRAALRERGIIEGIREEFIIRLAEHPIYGRRFRIAEGVTPTNGTDGGAIFHFDERKTLSLEPATMREQAFEDVECVEYVRAGDILCELTPPTSGTPGFSVMGDLLPGVDGVPSPVKPGTNAVLSEDGKQILASCDGQVYYKGDRVGVSRVMVLENVDQSTGNILFAGSILVRGDVEDGRLVQAGGNITVCGHVKNARLAAGRNLLLVNGITGAGDAHISAEGSMRARFIESANVKAGVDLYADSILHSKVECGENVVLFGKYGRLIGGSCRAGVSVTANEIGNRASIPTAVSIKKQVDTGARLELQAKIARHQETEQTLGMVINTLTHSGADYQEQTIAVIRAIYLRKQVEYDLAKLRADLDDPRHSVGNPGRVTAFVALYSDVHIEIHGAIMDTNIELGSCTVSRTGNRLGLSKPDAAPSWMEGK